MDVQFKLPFTKRDASELIQRTWKGQRRDTHMEVISIAPSPLRLLWCIKESICGKAKRNMNMKMQSKRRTLGTDQGCYLSINLNVDHKKTWLKMTERKDGVAVKTANNLMETAEQCHLVSEPKHSTLHRVLFSGLCSPLPLSHLLLLHLITCL